MTCPSNRTARSTEACEGPKGIGGWLTLPIAGVAGTLLFTLYNLTQAYWNRDAIALILASTDERLEAMRLPIAISMVGGTGVLVLASLCLYHIFTYAPSVPKIMTIFYLWMIVTVLGEAYADQAFSNILATATSPQTGTDIVRAVLGAMIWIPYFWRSRRVANTFGNRPIPANGA